MSTIRTIRRTYGTEPGCAPDGGCDGTCEPGYRDFPDQAPNPGCAAIRREDLWREAAHHAAAIDALELDDADDFPMPGVIRYTPAHVIVDVCTIDRCLERAIDDATRWARPGKHWKKIRSLVAGGVLLELSRSTGYADGLPRLDSGEVDYDELEDRRLAFEALEQDVIAATRRALGDAEQSRGTIARVNRLRRRVHLAPITTHTEAAS